MFDKAAPVVLFSTFGPGNETHVRVKQRKVGIPSRLACHLANLSVLHVKRITEHCIFDRPIMAFFHLLVDGELARRNTRLLSSLVQCVIHY